MFWRRRQICANSSQKNHVYNNSMSLHREVKRSQINGGLSPRMHARTRARTHAHIRSHFGSHTGLGSADLSLAQPCAVYMYAFGQCVGVWAEPIRLGIEIAGENHPFITKPVEKYRKGVIEVVFGGVGAF